MARIVELVVLINALGGLAALGARYLQRKRRAANLEHVRRLEQENEEIDRMLERRRQP